MAKYIPRLPSSPDVPTSLQKEYDPDKAIKYITFFGDASISEDTELYKEVYQSARLLAENGYGIVNGGGPGVMKASTDGAESVNGDTIAVYWEPKLAAIFEGKNLANVTDKSEAFSNYLMRTLGLIEHGQVFVVCQGGTGTMSEFAMVWALAKLYYGRHKPVILFGEFWPSLIETVRESMIIDDNELAVLHYAKNRYEVLSLIKTLEKEVESRIRRNYSGDEVPFILSPQFSEAYLMQAQAKSASHHENKLSKLTLQQLDSFREQVKAPARVLVAGVGAGHDLNYLAQFYSVIGVEPDHRFLHHINLLNPNADLVDMPLVDYEVQQNTFKGIWVREYLHHYENHKLQEVFAKLARGLVPGGVMHIIVREGNGEGYEEETTSEGTQTHYFNYFNELKVRKLATQNGLEIISLEKVQRSHRWLAVKFKKTSN